MSKFQKKAGSRSCKTPHNHHHFYCHHHCICPPCHCRKKLTLIAPLINNECPGEGFPPLSLTSHQHDAWPRNRHPLWPLPNSGDEYGNKIFPTGGGTVLYESLTWRTGNSETFPSGLYLPFLPSLSMCHTRLMHWLNLNFTTVFGAPLLITLKTAAIHPTSSILSPPKKASPPATRSCLLPPPWPSCSQATAAQPPLWPSCSSPPSTMAAATIVVTLTPPGLKLAKQ